VPDQHDIAICPLRAPCFRTELIPHWYREGISKELPERRYVRPNLSTCAVVGVEKEIALVPPRVVQPVRQRLKLKPSLLATTHEAMHKNNHSGASLILPQQCVRFASKLHAPSLQTIHKKSLNRAT
jgi:hypothetical protein